MKKWCVRMIVCVSAVLGSVSISTAGPADSEERFDRRCPETPQALSGPLVLRDDATFEEIARAYSILKQDPAFREDLRIEARRFVNAEDWEKAERTGSYQKPSFASSPDKWQKGTFRPYFYYGVRSFIDWARADSFVKRVSDDEGTEWSVDLLKAIHRMALGSRKLERYRNNRLAVLLTRGAISKQEYEALKKTVKAHDPLRFPGIGDFDFRGVLRASPLDELAYTGTSRIRETLAGLSADGRSPFHLTRDELEKLIESRNGDDRFFTGRELEAIRENRFIHISEQSIRKIGDDAFIAEGQYCPTATLLRNLTDAVAEADRELQSATSLCDRVRTLVRLNKSILGTHPFFDGNGRAVRFFIDVQFLRNGLPPQFYPNEQDLETADEVQVEFIRKGMVDYIRFYVDNLRRSQIAHENLFSRLTPDFWEFNLRLMRESAEATEEGVRRQDRILEETIAKTGR